MSAPKKTWQKLGTMTRSGWDGVSGNMDLDIGAIRLEDVGNIQPKQIFHIEVLNGKHIPVAAAGGVGVGTRVCFSGSMTAQIYARGGDCGEVFEHATYWLYEETPPYRKHKFEGWCFDKVTIPGDSGGPVWIEGTGVAVGLVSVGDNQSTCFASLLPDPENPKTRGAVTDDRLAIDGISLAR